MRGLRCGNSSVGRARPCQGRGREFESRFPLHDFLKTSANRGFVFFGTALICSVAATQDGLVAEWSCSGLQSRVRRFDSDPGLHLVDNANAGIAQLVEHDLAKVGVASSSLVSRSSQKKDPALRGLFLPAPRRRSFRLTRNRACFRRRAPMAKSVDATDLKSVGRKAMPVRVRLGAPGLPHSRRCPMTRHATPVARVAHGASAVHRVEYSAVAELDACAPHSGFPSVRFCCVR
jgi:hypothetical protein